MLHSRVDVESMDEKVIKLESKSVDGLLVTVEDGESLDLCEGALLKRIDGCLLAIEDGTSLAKTDGAPLATKDGVVLLFTDGAMLAIADGWVEGLVSGVKVGFEVCDSKTGVTEGEEDDTISTFSSISFADLLRAS